MGKRYYCDFCDRSFADSGINRKNHFKGVQHQRLRKQHYDSFREAATILAEDAHKMPCKRFQSGTCDFGDSCKFSHMTPERRQLLERQVVAEHDAQNRKFQTDLKEPSLEEWLEKRKKRQKVDEPSAKLEEVHYVLPPFLINIPSLPPSLLPPTVEELQNKHICEWG